MPIRYLLFDLDETLYPRNAGVMQQISRQIRRYIVETLGVSAEEADTLARRYHRDYGTSLQGLLANHHIDPDRYLNFVHTLTLDALGPDPALDSLLASLPAEKVIFTNADRAHAERVLQRLGIRRHFSRIIDVVAVDYVSKPNLPAYTTCLRLLDASADECVMIEDSGRNLQPAAALGMVTVLVDGSPDDRADYHIDAILELGPVIDAICAGGACE
ncbi:MAG: pyrimidine 5'-nucleotidase [Anaerolineae bacterium]|nr:pyrimidine 5'-nucleotidase [Anaerolineae bacterium]